MRTVLLSCSVVKNFFIRDSITVVLEEERHEAAMIGDYHAKEMSNLKTESQKLLARLETDFTSQEEQLHAELTGLKACFKIRTENNKKTSYFHEMHYMMLTKLL